MLKVVKFGILWYNNGIMNTKDNDQDLYTGWRETDPEKPVRRLFVTDEQSQGSVNRHPSGTKPKKKQLTGRVALLVADRREREERYSSKLGTGADLKGLSTEQLNEQANNARKIREQVFGHTPVADQLELDFSPEESIIESSDATAESVTHAADSARAAIKEAKAKKVVVKLPVRPNPNLPELPPTA